METLDRTKADLIINYESVVQSLKQLNRLSRERHENATNNNAARRSNRDIGENDSPENSVDKSEQRTNDSYELQRKGKSYVHVFVASLTNTHYSNRKIVIILMQHGLLVMRK